jgi:hypothetical protein
MRPYSVGGYYDQPIPRRIAEEAGIPRGTFATAKRGATAVLQVEGESAFAPATLAAVRDFARSDGTPLVLRSRARLTRWHRLYMRWAHRLRLARLEEPLLAYRRSLINFEPATGSILLRWAVTQIAPRYQAATELRGDEREREAATAER